MQKSAMEILNSGEIAGVTVKFETATCHRCSGSGMYPSSAWNGVCLNCNRAGMVYTANGKRARSKFWGYIRENFEVPVTSLQPGDMFEKIPGKWIKVYGVRLEDREYGAVLVTKSADGREIQNYYRPSDTVIRRPEGADMAKAVLQVAKMKGTILGTK